MNHVRLAVLLVLGLAVPASPQVTGGDIAGIIHDEQGGRVVTATVRAQGVDATFTAAVGAAGEFRFINLAPGPYQITVVMPGLTSVTKEVPVSVGRTVEVDFTLRVAPIVADVDVAATSPAVDATAMGTATTFDARELADIPTSRDPFSLVRSVPGVLVERFNVGGNETGQQLLATTKAGRPQDTSWTLDGVEITDMSAAGQSAAYFNFDNFEEVRVSTAGNDIRERTGGLNINLIVKRGENEYHGSLRGYYTGDSLQAANIPEELARLATPVTRHTADHVTRSSDAGFEVGGPLLRNRAWFYTSYSDQNVQLFRRSTGAIDRTTLHNPNVKINWQATPRDLVTFLYYNGSKSKRNRPTGSASNERPEATFRQENYYGDSPLHGLIKFGDDRVLAANTFLSAKYAHYNTGVSLTPEGGMNAQAGRNAVTATAYGGFQRQISARPQRTATADLHSFFSGTGGSHDVTYGAGFRRVNGFTENMWPGNGILALVGPGGDLRAQVFREGNGGNRASYLHFYAGDTISRQRLTIDLGLRYDRQWGEALASTSAANPAFPQLVPGIEFAGYDAPFIWNTLSPRAGASYALDEGRTTLLRVSYSRFAGQLGTSSVGWRNVAANLGSTTYRWADLNGDGYAQSEEVRTAEQLASTLNATNPSATVSPNQIDPDLKAPTTTNFIAGLDREVTPNTVATVTYSYSRTSNLFGNAAANLSPRVGLTIADYAPAAVITGTLPDGTPYGVQTYAADPLKLGSTNGAVLTNAPGYYTDYHGVELAVTKRLSQRWNGRLSVGLNNAREHFDDPRGRYGSTGNPTPTGSEPLVDGGQFAPQVNGGTGTYYLNAKWQINASGAYLAPYGVQLAANVFGRQGYPFAIVRNTSIGVAPNTERLNVLTTPAIDTFRYPDVWNLDLRVSRSIRYRGLSAQLYGDVFNVFNTNSTLVRVNDITSDAFNSITQNITPRILRLGVVVGF